MDTMLRPNAVSRSVWRLVLAAGLLTVATACGSQSTPSVGSLSSSPKVSAPSASPSASAALSAPTKMQIDRQLHNVVEVDYPDEHFSLIDGPVTVSDGSGGGITAVAGVRMPTADAKGQLVFFWHNRKFLGWVPRTEAFAVHILPARSAGEVAVEFALYPPGTAMCCPRGGERVTFRFTGSRMSATRHISRFALSDTAVRQR